MLHPKKDMLQPKISRIRHKRDMLQLKKESILGKNLR